MTFRFNIDLGLQHSNADALSRLPCKQCGLQTSTPPPGLPDAVKKDGSGSGDGAALLQEGSVCFLSVEDPKQLQDKDADLRQVILWLQHDDIPPVLPKDGSKCVQTLLSQKDHLVLDGGVLYRRWEDVPGKGFNPHLQLVIPRTSIQAVLKEFHDTPTGGHLGLRKTLEKVHSRFYWPGQRHNVVKACAECASRITPTRRRRAPMQSRLVRDHMGIQHLRQKTLYDRSSHGDPYKAGDLVWLHCPAVPRGKSPKLHCYWQGPYSVVKTLGDSLFLIQHRDSPRKRTVVHFDRLWYILIEAMYSSVIRGECCTSQ